MIAIGRRLLPLIVFVGKDGKERSLPVSGDAGKFELNGPAARRVD